MDIEVKNMSPEAVELLEQLSVVCQALWYLLLFRLSDPARSAGLHRAP